MPLPSIKKKGWNLRKFKRRLREQVIQATGVTKGSKDEEFSRLEVRFRGIEGSLRSTELAMVTWSNALESFSAASRALAEELTSHAILTSYDDTQDQDAECSASVPSSPQSGATKTANAINSDDDLTAQKCYKLFQTLSHISDEVVQPTQKVFVGSMLRPTMAAIQELPSVHRNIERRKRKLLDYDHYKRKVERLHGEESVGSQPAHTTEKHTPPAVSPSGKGTSGARENRKEVRLEGKSAKLRDAEVEVDEITLAITVQLEDIRVRASKNANQFAAVFVACQRFVCSRSANLLDALTEHIPSSACAFVDLSCGSSMARERARNMQFNINDNSITIDTSKPGDPATRPTMKTELGMVESGLPGSSRKMSQLVVDTGGGSVSGSIEGLSESSSVSSPRQRVRRLGVRGTARHQEQRQRRKIIDEHLRQLEVLEQSGANTTGAKKTAKVWAPPPSTSDNERATSAMDGLNFTGESFDGHSNTGASSLTSGPGDAGHNSKSSSTNTTLPSENWAKRRVVSLETSSLPRHLSSNDSDFNLDCTGAKPNVYTFRTGDSEEDSGEDDSEIGTSRPNSPTAPNAARLSFHELSDSTLHQAPSLSSTGGSCNGSIGGGTDIPETSGPGDANNNGYITSVRPSSPSHKYTSNTARSPRVRVKVNTESENQIFDVEERPRSESYVRGPAPAPPPVSHLKFSPNSLFRNLDKEIGSLVAGHSRRAATDRQASLLPGDAEKIRKALKENERTYAGDRYSEEFKEGCQTSNTPPNLPPRPTAASLAELDEESAYDVVISDVGSVE